MSAQSSLIVPRVKKIAILRPSAVGDFIFSLSALHALRRAYQDAQITLVGKPWHADFLRGRPGPVDAVAVMPPCPGVGIEPEFEADPAPIQRFVEDMRKAEFDLAFQMYGGGRYSNPLILQFGARLSLGMRGAGAVALDRWVNFGRLQNRRLQMLEVAALAGATTWSLECELQVTDADRCQAARILPSSLARPLVVLQPGASDRRRRWPPERFAAVGDILAREGALVAVHGSQPEVPLVHKVIEDMQEPALDLGGQLSLSGLCGLLERAALLVSNDTGPLHLALAIGTPGVGIYWLTNLIESGPLRQNRHRPALSVRVHCPVCGAENLTFRCRHDVSFVDDVSVEEVTGLAMDLFGTRQMRREVN